MHRHELDEATDRFVAAFQDRLPSHLTSFGPATPGQVREIARPHVEAILGDPAKVLETTAPLVAELLGAFVVVPAPAPAEAAPEVAKTAAKGKAAGK